MAKELPYFKYFPSEWVTGDITLCSMESQGLFVNICCYYWMKNCSMSLANAKQRFIKHEACLNELLNNGILKLDENENIIINFLDKQMSEFVNVSEKRSKSGTLGGLAKAKQLPKSAKAKAGNKDKDKDKELDKEKDNNIPTFDEFKNYVLENEPNIELKSLELKYKSWIENDWKDGYDKKIKNWKSKILNTIKFLPKNDNKINGRPKLAI